VTAAEADRAVVEGLANLLGRDRVLENANDRSVDEYAEVPPILAAHHRVIAVDTPGYGASDPVPGQPEIADYATALTAVLDELGIAKAIVVGHHTGALVAVEMAAANPKRVDRLALSGPIYMDAETRARLRPLFDQWRVQADGSHLKKKWDAMHAWLPRPELVQRFVVDLFRAGETREQGHLAAANYRMEDRLPLVRCPGLLIFSKRDAFAPAEAAGPFRHALRPCRETTLDAGIFPANEAPDEFARVLLDYVGGAP
jgi:pimeloyl-ACP methyl ester carboxylesterase